jgi:hypothetical protein
MTVQCAPYGDRSQCRGGGRGAAQPTTERREQQEREDQKCLRTRYVELDIAHRTDQPGKDHRLQGRMARAIRPKQWIGPAQQ